MKDFETHRIVTESGRFRALVFALLSGRYLVREPLGDYAGIESVFESIEAVEAWAKKRRWRLEKVNHFA